MGITGLRNSDELWEELRAHNDKNHGNGKRLGHAVSSNEAMTGLKLIIFRKKRE